MKKNKQKSVSEILESANKIQLYGRVSTDEQDEERQKSIIEDFLSKHNKPFNKDDFLSETKSAYSKSYEERKAFMELLNSLSEGDAIIVSDRDRLSRQTDDHFALREKLNELGIQVIVASKNEAYNNDDFLRNLVEDALTKLESDTISNRTKATMKTIVDKGEYIGGRVPYGYKEVTKKEIRHGKNKNIVIAYKPKPEELRIVKEVFEQYRTSETFNSIAKKFREEKKDNKWTADKVKRIILNPVYTGQFVYNRFQDKKSRIFRPETEWIWKKHVFVTRPIISEEAWWDCWNKYQKTKQKPRYLYTTFYFNDIIRCHCGEKMIGKDQRTKDGIYGYRYYVCQSKSCKCKVWCEELDKLFHQVMLHLPFPDKLIHYQIVHLINSELKETNALIDKCQQDLNTEKDNLETFNKYKGKLEKDDVFLQDSKNFRALAFLISKGDTEEQIEQLKKKLELLKGIAAQLHNLLKKPDDLREKVKHFFRLDEWKQLTDLQKRHIVLLATEECKLVSYNTVKLSLRCLPTHVLDLKGPPKKGVV